MGAGCSPLHRVPLTSECLGATRTVPESVLCCCLAFFPSYLAAVAFSSFDECGNGNLDGPRPLRCPGTRRDVAFLAQSPLNRVRRRKKKKKSIHGSLALSSGGQKDAEGCASLEPTCPPPRARPPAGVVPSLESGRPRLFLASEALGVAGGRGERGTRDPGLPHFLTPGKPLCPPAAPRVKGAFPRIQSALSAPHSCPSLNALPALSGPPRPLSLAQLLPWLPLRTPVPSPQSPHPPPSHFRHLAH